MVLPFLRRPQAILDLQLDTDRLSPGDTVNAAVSVSARKGFDVRSGTVKLECTETYWKWVTTYSGKSTSRRRQKRKRVLSGTSAEWLINTTISSGLIPRQQNVPLTLPRDAPPTIQAKSANLSWEAVLSLDIPGARDVHKKLPIPVLPRTAAASAAGSTLVENPLDDGTMRLKLNGKAWQAGGPVTGTLSLESKEPREFKEVRIELERYEHAGDKSEEITADSAVLDTNLSLGTWGRKEWSFALTLPSGFWPSTTAGVTTVGWVVKGIFARSLRRDHRVEVEIPVS